MHDRGSTPERRLSRDDRLGLAWLDYDNDGWMDLYVVQSGPLPPAPAARSRADRLYRNNGDGTFTDVTEKAGLHDTGLRDGRDRRGLRQRRLRGPLRHRTTGGNILYHNNGNGTFTDVTAGPGIRGLAGARARRGATSTATASSTSSSGSTPTTGKTRTCSAATATTGERDYCPPIMYDGHAQRAVSQQRRRDVHGHHAGSGPRQRRRQGPRASSSSTTTSTESPTSTSPTIR